MKGNRKLYNRSQVISAIGMVIALIWLTVSMPFVNASQKEWSKNHSSKSATPLNNAEEESSCPLGNTSEEKAPSTGNNLSEEFLHDHYSTHHFFSELLTYHKHEDDGTYIAFHGERLVPPPNKA